MLRAGARNPPLILMGLTEENISRLKAGYPIRAELKTFGLDMEGRVGIFYGKTHADCERILRETGGITEDAKQFVSPKVDQEEATRAQHKNILICTMGFPRSGKTTWAREQSFPIVNPDAIRLAIHGQRYQPLAEQFVWATAKAMVRALFLAGHGTVIVDATNTTKKRRDDWQSPEGEWSTFFKHIDTPAIVCTDRAKAENDKEIIPVIDRMFSQFEGLREDEKKW